MCGVGTLDSRISPINSTNLENYDLLHDVNQSKLASTWRDMLYLTISVNPVRMKNKQGKHQTPTSHARLLFYRFLS